MLVPAVGSGKVDVFHPNVSETKKSLVLRKQNKPSKPTNKQSNNKKNNKL